MCIDGIERSLMHPRVGRPTLLAATFLLAGCNGTTSYLDATGKAGHEEAVLGAWLTGVACAVVVLVCLAIVGGIGGCTLDSILGGTLQTQRWCDHCNDSTERMVHDCGTTTRVAAGLSWMDNDAVNAISSAFGALLGFLWIFASRS